jgi:hypothetical protein
LPASGRSDTNAESEWLGFYFFLRRVFLAFFAGLAFFADLAFAVFPRLFFFVFFGALAGATASVIWSLTEVGNAILLSLLYRVEHQL